MSTITITIEDEDGCEVEHKLPSMMEVCDECGGHTYVLCEGMRGHAYSTEEFNESFDDEEQAEYFRYGGMYDVVCHVCKGKNVVPVVDESMLDANQKKLYAEWQEQEEERWQARSMDRMMERAERAFGC